MREVLRALLDLQDVDRDLHRVQEELKRLPVERARRQAEIDKISALLSEKRTHAKNLRVRIKELEDTATIARQRQRKVENEQATARADVQLQAFYEHQVRTLKREIGTAEDDALKMMEQVEVLDRDAAEVQAKLDVEQKVFDLFAANVERELAEAEQKRAALAADRSKRKSTRIPPEAFADYERILRSRGGQALAQLDGRQCQACFMEVPTNLAVRVARGSELVRCPSCDRILYLMG